MTAIAARTSNSPKTRPSVSLIAPSTRVERRGLERQARAPWRRRAAAPWPPGPGRSGSRTTSAPTTPKQFVASGQPTSTASPDLAGQRLGGDAGDRAGRRSRRRPRRTSCGRRAGSPSRSACDCGRITVPSASSASSAARRSPETKSSRPSASRSEPTTAAASIRTPSIRQVEPADRADRSHARAPPRARAWTPSLERRRPDRRQRPRRRARPRSASAAAASRSFAADRRRCATIIASPIASEPTVSAVRLGSRTSAPRARRSSARSDGRERDPRHAPERRQHERRQERRHEQHAVDARASRMRLPRSRHRGATGPARRRRRPRTRRSASAAGRRDGRPVRLSAQRLDRRDRVRRARPARWPRQGSPPSRRQRPTSTPPTGNEPARQFAPSRSTCPPGADASHSSEQGHARPARRGSTRQCPSSDCLEQHERWTCERVVPGGPQQRDLADALDDRHRERVEDQERTDEQRDRRDQRRRGLEVDGRGMQRRGDVAGRRERVRLRRDPLLEGGRHGVGIAPRCQPDVDAGDAGQAEHAGRLRRAG